MNLTKGVSRKIEDVVALLDALAAMHGELGALADRKIDAMRGAKVEQMRAVHAQEQALVQRLQERNGLRRQLVQALAQALGVKSQGNATIRMLASRVSRSEADSLLSAAAVLRERIEAARSRWRQSARISAGVLNHLGWVLTTVRPTGDGSEPYTMGGVARVGTQPVIFEAVA